MELLLERVVAHPAMMVLLIVVFGIYLLLFRQRVRREQGSDCRKPALGHDDTGRQTPDSDARRDAA